MDVSYLKSEFLNVKSYLYELYEGNPRRNARKLLNSTNEKLDTLIKILHLICVGEIHLRKVDYETLKRSKRLNYLKSHFNTKLNYLHSLNAPREEKVNILRKFAALYKALLYTMFNLV